jgi:predicted metal-dependent peptidase
MILSYKNFLKLKINENIKVPDEYPLIIAGARTKMSTAYPFFGDLMHKMPMIENSQIETMCTDGSVIMYNLDFVNSLDHIGEKGQGRFYCFWIIAHEIMHCVLKHFSDARGKKPNLWNIACDCQVNLLLHEENVTIGKQPPDVCYDTRFAGKTALKIYEILDQQLTDIIRTAKLSGDFYTQGGGGGGGSDFDEINDDDARIIDVCPHCGYEDDGSGVVTEAIKICPKCGKSHEVPDSEGGQGQGKGKQQQGGGGKSQGKDDKGHDVTVKYGQSKSGNKQNKPGGGGQGGEQGGEQESDQDGDESGGQQGKQGQQGKGKGQPQKPPKMKIGDKEYEVNPITGDIVYTSPGAVEPVGKLPTGGLDKGEFGDVIGKDNSELSKEWDEAVRTTMNKRGAVGHGSGLTKPLLLTLYSLFKGQINWKKALQDFVANCFSGSEERYTRKRLIYAVPGENTYLRTDKPKYEGFHTAVLVVDTSGSIWSDPDLLAQFVTEIRSLLIEYSIENCFVLSCDTQIHNWQLFKSADLQINKEAILADKRFIDKLKLGGGGGTSFVHPFIWIKQGGNYEGNRYLSNIQDLAFVIYFTDAEGTFPSIDLASEYFNRVLWVVSSYANEKFKEVPFGKRIDLIIEDIKK